MSRADGIRRDAHGYMGALALGDHPRATDKPVRTYTDARRCSTSTCNTKLSIYNPDDHCARCEPERWADH